MYSRHVVHLVCRRRSSERITGKEEVIPGGAQILRLSMAVPANKPDERGEPKRKSALIGEPRKSVALRTGV